MDIVQDFYDQMASSYDRLFQNWQETTRQQAALLDGLLRRCGLERSARLLDCACGIGTQAIGLAGLGYAVTGSDISAAELQEAKQRAEENGVQLQLVRADFRCLEQCLSDTFDAIVCMDNALPHMLTPEDLAAAVQSILGRLAPGGVFLASIRDYDALLQQKPPYSPPYIHLLETGKRIAFQTWQWQGDCYDLDQYIIEDAQSLQVQKFTCRYRATRRSELTGLLQDGGCREVTWLMPEETGFYQPIVLAKK